MRWHHRSGRIAASPTSHRDHASHTAGPGRARRSRSRLSSTPTPNLNLNLNLAAGTPGAQPEGRRGDWERRGR
eukprot:2222321-Rhodomonas_salina.1